MIKSFRSKALKRLFENGDRRGVQPQFAAKIEIVLDALDAAQSMDDLGEPGYGTHALHGEREGEWAVVITRNWRVTFTPVVEEDDESENEGEFNIYHVDYEDYH